MVSKVSLDSDDTVLYQSHNDFGLAITLLQSDLDNMHGVVEIRYQLIVKTTTTRYCL